MKYVNEPLKKYLDDLFSRLPAPGGGSASASAAALGVGLLGMAANFTLDKKGYESCRDEIKAMLVKLESAKKRLSELIDLDVQAYEKFSEIYKLPKNTDEEKKRREDKMQETLKEAMKVPYEIMFICVDAIKTAGRLVDICNKNLVSDVGCGVLLLDAAMKSAGLNVDINLKSISDSGFVGKVLCEMDSAVSDDLKGIIRDILLKTERDIGLKKSQQKTG
jgi:methenyltetrahydrofolate cyclohydrolase